MVPWIRGRNFSQHHTSIMISQERNFRHNGTIFRVTLKSIMVKFTSIMCLTLMAAARLASHAIFPRDEPKERLRARISV